jgi:hypothetical protein
MTRSSTRCRIRLAKYYLDGRIKEMRCWSGGGGGTRENKSTTIILVGKSERNRSLGKFRRGKNSFQMQYKEILRKGVDWIHLVQTRDQRRAFVKTTMNPQFP